MDMDTPSPLPRPELARRLRGLARAVRALALLGALGLVALPPWIALGSGSSLEPMQGLFGGHLLDMAQGGITPAVRWRLALVTVLPVAAALSALWQLWTLFGAYRHGDVFGPLPLASLRRFGWAMTVLAAAQPLSTTLASVAASWDNPPGQRLVAVMLGSNDYALLMSALVFVALGRVMTEAARQAQEIEAFV
ncbi:DUF2975 domain-containing protein [Ideonella sp. 4Y16]|uniref:DUF2975 domain-containing protein n=1 Tax=Ideonella alba TaxID=2824118 RepID=A0A940YCM2_9BURK|nr:DUF2975 domain-containing protein [Ideonella alba]MBQ0932185.1 DUF2975 domain-containing protein [Ideonella alba]MBQ0943690.1 DUF2975 domain-containing protein [Ideonella alba]